MRTLRDDEYDGHCRMGGYVVGVWSGRKMAKAVVRARGGAPGGRQRVVPEARSYAAAAGGRKAEEGETCAERSEEGRNQNVRIFAYLGNGQGKGGINPNVCVCVCKIGGQQHLCSYWGGSPKGRCGGAMCMW